jgi:hypothetical protein
MLHKDYVRKGSVEKNRWSWISRGWSQDELIGGESPVVKWLWLWLSLGVLSWQLGCEDRRLGDWREMAASLIASQLAHWVAGYSPDSNDVSTEAEESPLLSR